MKRKALLGVIVASVVIILFIAFNALDYLILRFVPLPKELTFNTPGKDSALVLLNGKSLCGTCPAGKFMYRISGDQNVKYLVPSDYSAYDIENLRYTFDIGGEIVHAGQKTENLTRRISRCKKVKNLAGNFYLQLGKHNKIKRIEVF
jgi:hypothetical protein